MSGGSDDDLDLARRCAAGDDQAWERFIREYRPLLYRAADALDASGGARDIADSLYADLFGLKERGGERQSLFRYYQGRSSLATWLRAVLAQRYVDRLRAGRRTAPLPDEVEPAVPEVEPPDPEAARYAALLRSALATALAQLADRDRLRLSCYYGRELTLAQTGRVMHEHEATVSRQLARTRRDVRAGVERLLRAQGLGDAQVSRCFEIAAADPGAFDLERALGRRQESADQSFYKMRRP